MRVKAKLSRIAHAALGGAQASARTVSAGARASARAVRASVQGLAWIARIVLRPALWAARSFARLGASGARRVAAWRAGLRFARYVLWRHVFDLIGRRMHVAAAAFRSRRRRGVAMLRLDAGGAISAGLGRRALPVALMLLAGSLGVAARPGPFAPEEEDSRTVAMALMEDRFGDRPLNLAPATRVPMAAPASLAHERLKAHETYAFAPWWTLENSQSFDIRGLSTIAYFGVDVAGNGALVREGNGWTGYQSQALADLISRAHAAGIRVVLTAKTFVARDLRTLSTSPVAARRLAQELIVAIRAKNLDGVNLDFEGFGGDVRKQFPRFVSTVAGALHRANPAWQVTIDTYVSSAEIADDTFFDIPALEPSVDAFFVMGYDMYRTGVASPNAPLPRYDAAVRAYLAQVPATKIILGTPFYGYDWPTEDNRPHSRAVGEKTPITYGDIVSAGWPRYWDPVSQSPWTAYKVGRQWHEVYYDDPSSIALKTQLAQRYKLRGVGAWALGMEGSERDLIAALLGQVTAIIAGPAAPPRIAAQPAPTRSASPSPAPKPKPKPKPSSSPTSSASPSPSSSPLPVPLPTVGAV